MPITVSGTTITFNDSTTQTTAATSSVRGQFSQVFTSSGTFTIPTGVTGIYVEVIGGGGGGGGNNGWDNDAGGGGGASYTRQWYSGLTAGNTLTITVGAAGTAGTITGAGGAGGASSVASGTQTVVTCNSNGGGGGGPAGNGTNGTQGTGGAAGTTTFLSLLGGAGNDPGLAGKVYIWGQAGGTSPTGYGNGGGGRSATQTGSGYAGRGGIVIINY